MPTDAPPPAEPRDVVVIGAGPAGLSVAAELGGRGLQVECLAPSDDRFGNGYGLFVDEAEEFGLQAAVIAPSGRSLVRTAPDREAALERGYARIDPTRLQDLLEAKCRAASVVRTAGTVHAVEHRADLSEVVLDDGRRIQARQVIDASGHGGRFLDREEGAPAWQVAFGVELQLDDDPLPPASSILMDFSPVDDEDDDPRPTFLYALRLGHQAHLVSGTPDQGASQSREGGDWYFFEETSLCARPERSLDELEGRLERRLAARGLSLDDAPTDRSERCRIPMGGPLPRLDQRAVGFGGAARMVHPATGYMLPAIFSRAGPLSEAIAASLRGGAEPDVVARRAWEAVWPEPLRRTRDLSAFGLEVLLDLDAADTRRFFGAFFQTHPARWQAFLSSESDPAAAVETMLAMAAHLPARLVLRLVNEARRRPAVVPELARELPGVLARVAGRGLFGRGGR